MKNLKFTYIAVAIGIAFPLAAKAQDQVIPGQHNFTGPLKPIADWAQGVANRSVNDVNDAMRDLDKNAGSGDLDGVAVQKQTYDGRVATQKTIDGTLQEIQKRRDVVSQYIAAHPGDPQAIAIAKQLATLHNAFADFGNKNSDKIYLGTQFLQNHGVQNLPPVPNHVDKLPIPAAMPSGLEMQQQNDANKPPVTSDADKPLGPPTLRQDLDASYKTEDNLNKLIPLAQQYAALAAKNAQANPNDPVHRADAENAKGDLKNSPTTLDAINDGAQKYTDGTKSDAKSGDHASDFPAGNDPIADMLHMAGGAVVAMSSDQGQDSTQQFMNAISGNDGAGGGDTSNSSKANGREAARDAAKDAASAARDAASGAAREGAHAAADNMRNCPDGH
jgi:hypothetical protein